MRTATASCASCPTRTARPATWSSTITSGFTAARWPTTSSEEDLRRILDIRETIASHLQKEEVLFRQGIKCLSLFFIDEVAKYRVYDEDGSEGVGEYGRIFEEEYARAISERTSVPTLDDAYDPAYLRYLRSFDAHEVHKGYFSIDKKGRACNSKRKRGSEFAEGEDAVAAY